MSAQMLVPSVMLGGLTYKFSCTSERYKQWNEEWRRPDLRTSEHTLQVEGSTVRVTARTRISRCAPHQEKELDRCATSFTIETRPARLLRTCDAFAPKKLFQDRNA